MKDDVKHAAFNIDRKRNAQRGDLESVTEFRARTAPKKTPPKVFAVRDPMVPEGRDQWTGEYLTGPALRARLISAGVIVPLEARTAVLKTDDVGRVEAANGIFYNEDRRIVACVEAGGDTRGVLVDPVVVETIRALRACAQAFNAREGMFAPGGGKVRYERWPHPAPEEPDESVVIRDPKSPCSLAYPTLGNRPSPDRDALALVMSPREARIVPGTDEDGRWIGHGRIDRPYVRGDK